MSEQRLFLPRRCRLSRKEYFSKLLRQRPHHNRWFAVYVMPNQEGYARLGIVVSKRLVPKAVRRNRVKRLIRECFRTINREGIGKDVVVRLRSGLEKNDEAEARSVLTKTLRDLLCPQ